MKEYQKDEGGRMKDENDLTSSLQWIVFILPPSSFILLNFPHPSSF
jgi:hypothetical protein